MSGRHRHAVNVRTDGLAAVLGSLAHDPRIRSAALVDVDSGMVLDSCGRDAPGDAGPGPDTETRGAAHAELARTALALSVGAGACEVVVQAADGTRHVVQPVADPHGDRLALAVVVDGSERVVARVRRRLQAVSAAALTAGPSTALRPTADGWRPNRLLPPAPPPRPAPPPAASPAVAAPPGPTPPSPTPPSPTPLWVTADHVAPDGDGPRPALAALPRQAPPATPPLPRRTPGSAWTAPPAPATPVDMEPAGPAPAAPPPGRRRPAPPSALPPAVARPDGPVEEDRLSRPRVGPA